MDDCVFCKVIAGAIPAAVVYEDEHALAFLDIQPAARYHTLVIPKRHFADAFEVPETEFRNVMGAAKQVINLYKKKLGIENLQVVINSGAQAQQEVSHLHVHIVPRQAGDGQDLKWATHPEWRADIEDMLATLG